jgi:tripartite ATP-independent transporter DctP family solute receptor
MGRVVKRSGRAATAAAGALLLTAPLAACGGDSTSDAGSSGETLTLIAGHQLAADTPFDQGLDKFAELVEEKTDGQVTVEVHPSAELGTETEMFQGMQNGTIDVAVVAPGSIAEFVPQISILSMPFLVTSREQRDEIIDGPIADELAKTVEDATGTRPLSYFGGGIRNMFFTEPVKDVNDIDGRLFRVQPSEVLTDSFSAVGLEPTVVAYNELYNALQQGVVEGAENESVFIQSQKFFEPAPHILLTQHEVTIRPLMIASSTCAMRCSRPGRRPRSTSGTSRPRRTTPCSPSSASPRASRSRRPTPRASRRRWSRSGRRTPRSGASRTCFSRSRTCRRTDPMNLLVNQLYRLLLVAVTVLLAVLTAVVSYQVIGRYVPFVPRALWTEEISRLCLAWTVFLGAALAVRRSEHFVIDAIPKRVEPWLGKPLQVLTLLLVGAAGVVMLVGGLGLAETGIGRVSTTSGIRLVWAFAAMPVSGACVLVFAVELLARMLRGEDLAEHVQQIKGDEELSDQVGQPVGGVV